MCGACGTGLARPPWEVHAHGGSQRDLAKRAAEAERLCEGKLRIRPYGPAGYQTTTRTGATHIHKDLDELLHHLMTKHTQLILKHLNDPGAVGPVTDTLRDRIPH